MELPRLLLEMSALLTVAVLMGLVARRMRVPLSVVLVVVGFLAAAVGLTPEMGRLEGEAFEEVVVVFIFLPVLVFAAALGIDLRAFVRNLGAIVALATVAFLESAVVVGLTLHWLLGTALAVAFLFGALISATAPVAVVAVFREVGVPRRLLALVEGRACSTTVSRSCSSRSSSRRRRADRWALPPASSTSSSSSAAGR